MAKIYAMAGYVATIGMFDGVHLGHQFVLHHVVETARERGLLSMAVTFDRHPRQVLQPAWHPQLLLTADEKLKQLQATGVDRVEVLCFDAAMARLSAQTFMQQVLKEQLGVSVLLMGYDNRFGSRREDSFDDYVAYGRQVGIEVVRASQWTADGQVPCSSLIRQKVTDGEVHEAALLMGHPYTLSGTIVHGRRIGHSIGFPTANLQPYSPDKIVPRSGVYAVTAQVDDDDKVLKGMMNIGMRPTFDGHHQTLETHLFDVDADLYDHQLTVTFVDRLRDEQPFPDAEALVRQMNQDKQQAIEILKTI